MNVAAKAVRMLFKQLLITLYEDSVKPVERLAD